MKVTQAQLDALYRVYLRWQDKTPHPIMPADFEIVTEDEYAKGDYIGVWVGGHPPCCQEYEDGSRGMYLGIEADGHTHS